MEMPKRYDAKETEPRWTKYWEEKKVYAHEPKKGSYMIDTPPPTVSGKMHIGHACSYAQEDFYARFFRMRTGKVFYPFGTDDNGLPTERLVERTKKVKATKMSRKEFRDLCYSTIKELKPDFIQDWKDIGMSCDFATTYSTISEEAQAISQRSFIDLYKKGRAYREEAPVAWCVHCQTAIAQAEFDNIEKQSQFNDIAFQSGTQELVISTTRPELIPACVALAAHPDDDRYAGLEKAIVPLSGHEVKIIFDESVDMEKGTGLMMVCTFGDREDVEKWHKHKLPLRAIFMKEGKLNDLAGAYEGLGIEEARDRIIEDLKKENLLKSQKQVMHAVNVHERCGTPIEFLKTNQWYVKVLDIKDELLEAGRRIRWHPEFMHKRYEHWVENLGWDWCISRQRYFGVPFPIWYTKDGGVVIADESQLPVDPFTDRPKGKENEDLDPEQDVMDTWATSSMTPQIALGWERAQEMLPMSLRPQAHDIIRTWAFYTIVKASLNNDSLPWNDIAVSGYVMDPKGEKMSKSKGNVVDPRKVLEKYSADAIRFWAASAKLGDDIPYQEKELVTGTKTINKLWNASKFVLMNLDGEPEGHGELEPFDEWMLAKYNSVVEKCTQAFESYDHSKARHLIDGFFWNDFCDDYLEIVKGRLYGPEGAQKEAARHTLLVVLEGTLKMFAPFMPYVTEEIYQYLSRQGSIHVSSWPSYESYDGEIMMLGDAAASIIRDVRKFKTEKQMSMRSELERVRIVGPAGLSRFENDLKNVTKARKIIFETDETVRAYVD